MAIAELDAGAEHAFGAPTGFELVHDGRRYPPKAVTGMAHRHLAGRRLLKEEFSGGEGSGQANPVLRELGFEVEPMQRGTEPARPPDDHDVIGTERSRRLGMWRDLLDARGPRGGLRPC